MPIVEIIRKGKRTIRSPLQDKKHESAVTSAPAAPRPLRPDIPLSESIRRADDLFAGLSAVWRDYEPLVIGVSDELLRIAGEVGISRQAVRLAIKGHCQSEAYLTALAQDGARRKSLDGGDAGEVSGEAKTLAIRRLENLKPAKQRKTTHG